ncbi:MAG: THUMP domain-containing protein [Bacteriovoracaceae bacterium]
MIENIIKYQFFIIIPPGLEELAAMELEEKCPDLSFNTQKGGIDIETDLLTGLGLNYLLKIPNRILIRIAEFKCRDFPKLFNKLKKIDWNDFISTAPTSIKTSSTSSRIFDSRKIEKTFQDAFKAYRKGRPQKSKFLESQKGCEVFLRFHNDTCTVSINTSGERLHKRGLKTQNSIASIRENLASALFYYCLKQTKEPIKVIFNPMAGAGTLLIEAAYFYKNNDNREFDFLSFPILKNKAINLDQKKLPNYKLIGLDQSQQAQKAFEANTSNAKLDCQYIDSDFFAPVNENFPKPTLTLINPPYGKRLKTEQEKLSFFNKCIKSAINWGKPDIIGIVAPSEFIRDLDVPEDYEALRPLEFENGGIPVLFRPFLHLKK